MVIALGAGYAETCKSGSGGGSAETAGESQYGAAGSTSHLMQANCSFLVTDPKGEMLRAVAPLLIQRGYVIKVFDLIDPANSDAFNPFPYIRDDKDAMKLVERFKREEAQDRDLLLYLWAHSYEMDYGKAMPAGMPWNGFLRPSRGAAISYTAPTARHSHIFEGAQIDEKTKL